MNKKISLSLFLAASTLLIGCDKLKGVEQASNPPAAQTQPIPAQQAAQQPQVLPAVQQSAAAQDPMLMVFNQSVKITAMARNIVIDDKNNQGSLVVYRVENISKKPITSVVWTTAFTLNNQVFHTANVNVNLAKQPLQAHSATEVRALDLFQSMPAQAKAIFQDPTQQVGVLIVARELSFADGSKFIVSE